MEVGVEEPVRIRAEGVGGGVDVGALPAAGLVRLGVLGDERAPLHLGRGDVDVELLERLLDDERRGDELGVLGRALDLDLEAALR
jgi:hypothetical protein